MNVKYYGLDSTLIHDAKPCDGFVIDVVRASDYAVLLSKLKSTELRLREVSTACAIAEQRLQLMDENTEAKGGAA